MLEDHLIKILSELLTGQISRRLAILAIRNQTMFQDSDDTFLTF